MKLRVRRTLAVFALLLNPGLPTSATGADTSVPIIEIRDMEAGDGVDAAITTLFRGLVIGALEPLSGVSLVDPYVSEYRYAGQLEQATNDTVNATNQGEEWHLVTRVNRAGNGYTIRVLLVRTDDGEILRADEIEIAPGEPPAFAVGTWARRMQPFVRQLLREDRGMEARAFLDEGIPDLAFEYHMRDLRLGEPGSGNDVRVRTALGSDLSRLIIDAPADTAANRVLVRLDSMGVRDRFPTPDELEYALLVSPTGFDANAVTSAYADSGGIIEMFAMDTWTDRIEHLIRDGSVDEARSSLNDPVFLRSSFFSQSEYHRLDVAVREAATERAVSIAAANRRRGDLRAAHSELNTALEEGAEPERIATALALTERATERRTAARIRAGALPGPWEYRANAYRVLSVGAASTRINDPAERLLAGSQTPGVVVSWRNSVPLRRAVHFARSHTIGFDRPTDETNYPGIVPSLSSSYTRLRVSESRELAASFYGVEAGIAASATAGIIAGARSVIGNSGEEAQKLKGAGTVALSAKPFVAAFMASGRVRISLFGTIGREFSFPGATFGPASGIGVEVGWMF